MTRPTYTADKELSNGFRERDREPALERQRSIPGRIYYTLLTLAALAGVGSLLRWESWACGTPEPGPVGGRTPWCGRGPALRSPDSSVRVAPRNGHRRLDGRPGGIPAATSPSAPGRVRPDGPRRGRVTKSVAPRIRRSHGGVITRPILPLGRERVRPVGSERVEVLTRRPRARSTSGAAAPVSAIHCRFGGQGVHRGATRPLAPVQLGCGQPDRRRPAGGSTSRRGRSIIASRCTPSTSRAWGRAGSSRRRRRSPTPSRMRSSTSASRSTGFPSRARGSSRC